MATAAAPRAHFRPLAADAPRSSNGNPANIRAESLGESDGCTDRLDGDFDRIGDRAFTMADSPAKIGKMNPGDPVGTLAHWVELPILAAFS